MTTRADLTRFANGAERVAFLRRRWGLTHVVAAEVQHLLWLYPSLRITSGYRGPKHNAAVGGAPRSFHLLRRAVDLTGRQDELLAARRHARRTRAVEVIDEGDHTHLAW